jgi:GT2 family glycosyltransferase
MEQPRVAIVILNWNGWSDTNKCLESMYNIKYKDYYIVVVDNDSADDSYRKIKDNFERVIGPSSEGPAKILEYTKEVAELGSGKEKEITRLPSNKRLIMIKNDRNLGFAGGNNVGIEYALKTLDPKYILLLNNDTFVDQFFLTKLVEAIEADEKIGSVQSLLLKSDGKHIDSLGQYLSESGAYDLGSGLIYKGVVNNTEIFGPCAAAALYRSASLRDVGLFDESFFVIFEDVDLSWRIRLKGYSSFLVPSSIVYHKRGVSAGWRTRKPSRTTRYYSIKNWLIIAVRYYPSPHTLYTLHKFLHYLFWSMLYALKMRRSKETIRQLYDSLVIRKGLRENAIWTEIQSRWIQPLSSDSIVTHDRP